MPTITSAGVYLLAAEHADAVQRFTADVAFATMVGIPHPVAATAGADAIARTTDERVAGAAYWNAIVDGRDVKGVATLRGPYADDAHVQVWIDPAVRRKGYGALAVRMVLEFAFRNLQRAHVTATPAVGDLAAERTLAKFGFTPSPATPNAPQSFVLTRADWIAHRDRPAIAALRPELRTILDAELAAGNEDAESGGGWPDADSIFIRLRDPFRTKPSPLPSDVVYTEPNDPHWWRADYRTRTSPRHILAS